MYCANCGENMCGDGQSVIYHCPNAPESDYYDHEPDASPVMCRAVADEYTTCWACLGKTKCPFAWDPYNVDGACLAEK